MPQPSVRALPCLAFLLASIVSFSVPARSQVAAAPSLVRDITSGLRYKDESGESRPVAAIGDLVFFLGTDPAHGGELWRSDGTAEGTFLLKDIVPGPGAGVSDGWWGDGDEFVFDEAFYFKVQKYERPAWWKTDGTTAGTVPFLPDFRGTLQFFPADETLYLFRNCPGAGACELWKSDGTLAGTLKVKSLPPMATSLAPTAGKAGGLLFFSFPGAGRELWRSDGTEAGTYRIGSFDGLSLGPASGELGGTLFFGASEGSSGLELWKSDGTEAGTVRVRDIWPGAGSSDPRSMRSLGGILYFSAEDGASGRELWRSDGTEAGTVQVRDVWPGPHGSDIFEISSLGETLFFSGEDSAGPGLWKSDGTEAGTLRVGGSVFTGLTPGPLRPAGDLLFFAAIDEEHGMEVWRSDGTDAGTFVVKDIEPGPYDSIPQNLIANGETLYFYAVYPVSSGELWKSDGTEEGTVVVRELVRQESSVPFLLTVSGDQLFFGVRERAYERSLWKSDGTAAGTGMVTPKFPLEMLDFQDTLYFNSFDSGLWRTDGTPTGLGLVAFHGYNQIGELTEAGGRLFYRAASPLLGEDLYDAHAGLVKDLWPGSLSSRISELTAINGILFFRVDGEGSSGLWRSDGTAPGTFQIAEVPARQLTRAGNLLYFTVFDESSWSHALWRTDGSSGGTYPIGSWNPGDELSELTEVNGQLFFALSLATGWQELRRSDGGGTYHLWTFESRSPLTELTGVGTRLYFTAEDANGRELWRNDGTPGAIRVKDIHPGPASSLPQSLAEATGWLVFSAIDPAHGRELWMSDGTEGDTFLVADIAPGPPSSWPEEMTSWDRKVYFSADNGSTGVELWSFEIEGEPVTTDTPPAMEDLRVHPNPAEVGERVTVAMAFTDPDPYQAHTVIWTWGDGDVTSKELPPGPGGYGSTGDMHVYTEPGVYSVVVEVIDETGLSASWSYDALHVQVPNTAPIVESLVVTPDPVPVGATVSAVATIFDPDPDQYHNVLWTWGDGTSTTQVLPPGPGGSEQASSSHTYTESGFYTVTAFAADESGWGSTGSSAHVTVYDPNGPSVKGAGWIPLASGKGTFQLDASYPQNGLHPTGKVQFKAPGVDLRSRSLDVLVVKGPTAWLFGKGIVNGQADCQLWLAMTDGQAPGGGGVDRLHLRIWCGGQVVFDNEPGTPNEAPPVTALGGGTIHFKP